MSSSELRNRANPLNKWASNKSAIEALPSNLKVAKKTRSLASLSKNLQINFLKCNGVIAPVSNAADNKQFTLDVSTLTYFVNYTDFNNLNPDASVVVKPQVFSDWYDAYLVSKNPAQGSNILPYAPSTIISYHDNTGKKLNYICQITNIVKKSDGNPLFTFDTSKVVFYDKNSNTTKKIASAAVAAAAIPNVSSSDVYNAVISSHVPIVNNPEISKIDINFLSGTFIDIRIDFDPLYDPLYKYNGDMSYFLQSDMKLVNNNGKYIASVPMSDRFVLYRSWCPNDQKRNQELEVYIDDISYFTRMFKSAFSNRTDTSQDSFKPSTTLEFRSRNGKTYTCIVQITDCYVYKDNILFELDNEIVKMYDDNSELVSSYKSISKILKEGSYTQVRMDIDSGACGNFSPSYTNAGGSSYIQASCSPPNCSATQNCYYDGWSCCCTTSPSSCHDDCNCFCFGAGQAGGMQYCGQGSCGAVSCAGCYNG
jgi:hypothetical protein